MLAFMMKLRLTTRLVFGLAFAVHVLATTMWYGTLSHQPPILRYLPYMSGLFCGFLVGLLGNRGYFRKTLAMGVLLAVISSIVHWLAGYLGVRVDFDTVSASAMIVLIAMPIWITLSMLGGALGLLARSLVSLKKYHDSGPHEGG